MQDKKIKGGHIAKESVFMRKQKSRLWMLLCQRDKMYEVYEGDNGRAEMNFMDRSVERDCIVFCVTLVISTLFVGITNQRKDRIYVTVRP